MFENINEVAVIVSAIIAVALGNIWYSPFLFGKMWAKSLGNPSWTQADDGKVLAISAVKSVLAYIVIFFVIAKIVVLSHEVESVSLLSLVSVMVVFVLAHAVSPVIWEKKPFSYFLIHAGYFAVVLFVGLGVISKWPW